MEVAGRSGTLEILPDEYESLIENLTVINLYNAQKHAAISFEAAFLSLANFPDLAGQIRMTAYKSRTLHYASKVLMEKFAVTANNVVNTIIPMINDAVEFQDSSMADICFDLVIEKAATMKKEVEETQESYHRIIHDVQDELKQVGDRKAAEKDANTKRKIEIEYEEQIAAAAESRKKQYEEDRKKQQEDIKRLKSLQDNWNEELVRAVRDGHIESDDVKFLSTTLGVGQDLGGGVVLNKVFDFFKSTVNGIKDLFDIDVRRKTLKIASLQIKKTNEEIKGLSEEERRILNRIHKQKIECAERLAKLKELRAMAKSGIGNIKMLAETSDHLGAVDEQLTKIADFWANVGVLAMHLKEDAKDRRAYASKIEDERYKPRLLESIAKIKKEWLALGWLCRGYVEQCQSEIEQLYFFLSGPVDRLPFAAREQRINALFEQLQPISITEM